MQMIKVNPMKKLVVSNQKGGVGKTFISTHLAHFALEKKLNTLFIDNDTQGNAGFSLGDFATQQFNTIDIYTKDIDFKELMNEEGHTFILFKGSQEIKELSVENFQQFAINIQRANDFFDICIFDTAPTEGSLQDFPMLVSDFILSPFQLDNYSYNGFKTLIQRITEIQELNESIHFLGFIPNHVDLRSTFDKEQLEEVTGAYSSYMFGDGLYIPLRSAIKVATHTRVPVWKVKNSQNAAKLVRKLSKDVFNKIGV